MEENTPRKDFWQVKHGDNVNIDSDSEDSEILIPNQVTFKLRAVIIIVDHLAKAIIGPVLDTAVQRYGSFAMTKS